MQDESDIRIAGYDLGRMTVESQLSYAEDLAQAGRYSEARQLLEKICEDHPGNFDAHMAFGRLALTLQQPGRAAQLFRQTAEIDPTSELPYLSLAEVFAGLEHMQDTRDALEKAMSLAPDSGEPYVKLALLALKTGDKERAAELCERGLSIDPELIGAHQILGMLLREQGRLKASARHLARARAQQPPMPDPYNLLALNLFALGSVPALIRLPAPGSNGELFAEQVLVALDAWQESNFERCGTALRQAQSLLPHLGTAPNRQMFGTLLDVVEALLGFFRAHPEIYGGDHDETVHLVGDAHCLSGGHLRLTWQKRQFRMKPSLILSCKASHLKEPTANPYGKAYLFAVRHLPAGASVIACFGGLDCNYRDGLFQTLKADPGQNPEQAVCDLVEAYVGTILETAAKHDHRVLFMSPPMSNLPAKRIPLADREAYRVLIECFNRTLRETVLQHGKAFIDLFGNSRDKASGAARSELYIDSNHVLPEAVRAALENIEAPEIPRNSLSC